MGGAGAAVPKVLRNANPSVGLRYFQGVMLWHTVSSELSLPSCLACRWSRLHTARHRPKNVQPVRRHGRGAGLSRISAAIVLAQLIQTPARSIPQPVSCVDRNATVTKSYDRTVAETAHAA